VRADASRPTLVYSASAGRVNHDAHDEVDQPPTRILFVSHSGASIMPFSRSETWSVLLTRLAAGWTAQRDGTSMIVRQP
jgi:hypothetical protein